MRAAAVRGYGSSAEHLLAEIGWLDLLIRREILSNRTSAHGTQSDPFKGLYVSEDEVARLIAQGDNGPRNDGPDDKALIEAAAVRRDIDDRRQASIAAGIYLALAHLSHLFGLTPFEERIVVLALASEIDVKYERLFAWLQDDISRKRPCVDLALRLFCANPDERLALRSIFKTEAPLSRGRLLRSLDKGDSPLLSRPLVLDDRIASFLLSNTASSLPTGSRIHTPARPLEQLRWSERMRSELLELIRNHAGGKTDAGHRLVLNFCGRTGSGRKTLASGLCQRVDMQLLVVDVQELATRSESFEEELRAACRHSLLHRCAIYLEHTGAFLADDEKGVAARTALCRAIADFSSLNFVATETGWVPGDTFRGHTFLTVELSTPDIAERESLWASFAAESGLQFVPGISWVELAAKFRLTPGQIESAIETAGHQARLRSPKAQIEEGDLHKGCYAQSNPKLAALAGRLEPRYTWQDITLPPSAMAQLREVCAQLRHRRIVYGDWGFGKKQSLGKGLAVLFYGQSGVGKTMAVEVIANELQLEAFKIDLSTVVSKYIGETEKNLSKIFQEAESSNAILFFDEADALFGKRSEVKDAHDRYANIEINYLLQRIEEFGGLVILATNLRKNIDDGFFRRMHFAVEFPFPDATYRYRIWKQHLPETAPIKGDIDFDYLAERFNLAGGSIRNVVVHAAFLAADDGTAIGMEHLIRATRREYEKIGRVCTDMDFGPYQKWLAETRTLP